MQEALVGGARVGGLDEPVELEGHRAVHGAPDLLGDVEGVTGRIAPLRHPVLDVCHQLAEGRACVLLTRSVMTSPERAWPNITV